MPPVSRQTTAQVAAETLDDLKKLMLSKSAWVLYTIFWTLMYLVLFFAMPATWPWMLRPFVASAFLVGLIGFVFITIMNYRYTIEDKLYIEEKLKKHFHTQANAAIDRGKDAARDLAEKVPNPTKIVKENLEASKHGVLLIVELLTTAVVVPACFVVYGVFMPVVQLIMTFFVGIFRVISYPFGVVVILVMGTADVARQFVAFILPKIRLCAAFIWTYKVSLVLALIAVDTLGPTFYIGRARAALYRALGSA